MFGLFDKAFDFNHDGKLDSFERAAQFYMMNEMMEEAKRAEDDERDVFGEAGLDSEKRFTGPFFGC